VRPEDFAGDTVPHREPRAEMRTAAAGIRDMYLALLEQGFAEDQALTLVGRLIASQQGRQA
jgi:hypothetical protein